MCHVSNTLMSILNMGTLGISIILIFLSSSLPVCGDILKTPLLFFGVFLFTMSLFALIGLCCRISTLLWLYLFVLLLMIIGLFCFSVFSFIVTYKGAGKQVPDRGYKEYELDEYSGWLKKNVVNDKRWVKIKSCLSGSMLCMNSEPPNGNGNGNGGAVAKAAADANARGSDGGASEFYKIRLTSTESGCCKPPSYCGFEYQNRTYWTVPKGAQITQADDCRAWSNNQTELCFNCGSCKAGVLDNIKREWKQMSIILTCILVFLNIVYAVGCCALDNTRAYRYHRAYP
ncbi:tetraspanin-8-like [Cornus florida]|uniref:tetraspanin-8-like n=1 Tax=Cornus florida TaxID=4283 RepID=UPI00289B7DD8|nr:tetraspanin-8-like [Cornus florida]